MEMSYHMIKKRIKVIDLENKVNNNLDQYESYGSSSGCQADDRLANILRNSDCTARFTHCQCVMGTLRDIFIAQLYSLAEIAIEIS